MIQESTREENVNGSNSTGRKVSKKCRDSSLGCSSQVGRLPRLKKLLFFFAFFVRNLDF
jgi:hypothetical protein